MGPADKQPVFPRYDIFEDLADDEEIVIVDHFAFGGPVDAPCNWFQTHENAMDPYHVFILHNAISGHQFDPKLEIWPHIEWQRHEWGVTATQDRRLPDGTILHRITETRTPTIRVIPTPTLSVLGPTNNMSWAMPIDATNTRVYAMVRKPRWRSTTGPAGVRRQPELVRAQRRGAPALPRRLRDPGRPGCDHPSLRGAPGGIRPRCVDGEALVQGTGAHRRHWWQPRRRALRRSRGAADRDRRELHRGARHRPVDDPTRRVDDQPRRRAPAPPFQRERRTVRLRSNSVDSTRATSIRPGSLSSRLAKTRRAISSTVGSRSHTSAVRPFQGPMSSLVR